MSRLCPRLRFPPLDKELECFISGPHTVTNLVAACGSCNSRKGAKPPHEYAKTLGRLF